MLINDTCLLAWSVFALTIVVAALLLASVAVVALDRWFLNID